MSCVRCLRRIKSASMKIFALLALCLSMCWVSFGQEPVWRTSDPAFHAVAITSSADLFWVCGPNESIASSPNGKDWTVRHHASGAGAMLFGIEFFSPKFGYAYGTGGTVLFTNDGGANWGIQHFGSDTILLASFSDPIHGLFRTASSLYFLDGSVGVHQIEQPADTLMFTSSAFLFSPC
jgi:hypothetical protein